MSDSSDRDRRILASSRESDWRTPRPLFDALNREFVFDVDAAADERSTLVSRCWYGPGSPYAEDALAVDWPNEATIFLNPPYSRERGRQWQGPGTNPYRIQHWAEKCWRESQRGSTIVAILPFSPQTDWYRAYVQGHSQDGTWSGHAAQQERRLPHRISFDRPDGRKANNANINTAIMVWTSMRGVVGPWQPHTFYWSWK